MIGESSDSTALMTKKPYNYGSGSISFNSNVGYSDGSTGSNVGGLSNQNISSNHNGGFRPRSNYRKSGLFCEYYKFKGHTKDAY